METRRLGRTDLEVSRLGMGGLFVSSVGGDLEQARAAVRRARELGVNYVDTAPSYANSEEVLGKILPGIEQPVVLSTKLGGRPKPFDPRNVEALRWSVKESLRLLHRDQIDILMIHEPDRPGQYDWWTDFGRVAGPVLGVCEALKKEGVVRYVGLGGTTTSELAHLCRSGHFDVVLTAFNYSLLWREARLEVIPAAREVGMGIVAGSALQQGALARRFGAAEDESVYWLSTPRREQFRALYAFSTECGLSLPELAFRFVISSPDIDCVLMGARSASEVEQNVAAVERGPLPADVLARLDEIAAMVPFRPFNEPFGLGWILGDPSRYRGPGHA